MFFTLRWCSNRVFFNMLLIKMLSRPQNIRVGRVDNFEIFWPDIFTEETGLFFFLFQDIIKSISRYCNH